MKKVSLYEFFVDKLSKMKNILGKIKNVPSFC